MTNYESLNLKQLKQEAKKLGLKGYHNLAKAELIAHIQAAGILADSGNEEEKQEHTEIDNSVTLPTAEDILNSLPDDDDTIPYKGEDHDQIKSTETDEEFKSEGTKEPSVPKVVSYKRYDAAAIGRVLIEKVPNEVLLRLREQHRCERAKLDVIIDQWFSSRAPYTEEQVNSLLEEYVPNFEQKVVEHLEQAKQLPVQLTREHKNWMDYLKLYKFTPQEMLQRYPAHRSRDILEDLVRYYEQMDKLSD